MDTAPLQQFLNIAERKRIAKIPPDGTKYEAECGCRHFKIAGLIIISVILSRH